MAAKKPVVESATPASDKKKALETAMAQIERAYGKGSIMRLGENADVVVRRALSRTSSSVIVSGGEMRNAVSQ